MKAYNYIYKITNNINGKLYIGKHSKDNLDDGYMGSGILIKKAITKYGIENFTKEYLAFCDNEDTLNYLEKFYIKKYKAREVGYNLTDGGDGQLGVPRAGQNVGMYGKHHSEETKQKIGEALKGKKRKPFSKEHKKRISVALSNRVVSEETKQKISEARKGIISPMKGKHHSIETKNKISKSNSGKHLSEESKQKISEAHKGNKNPFYHKHLSKEHRKKISESHKGIQSGENNPMYGKHHSEETKLKISASKKGKHKVWNEDHTKFQYK